MSVISMKKLFNAIRKSDINEKIIRSRCSFWTSNKKMES